VPGVKGAADNDTLDISGNNRDIPPKLHWYVWAIVCAAGGLGL